MNDSPPMGPIDWLCLLLVLVCAAGTRAGYVYFCAAEGQSTPAFAVQGQGPVRPSLDPNAPARTELDDLIQHVREERRFACRAPLSDREEETAHVAPGYPWLLGMVGRLHDQPEMLVRWTQCGLGALTVLCWFCFARRAFASTVAATIAGLLGAFYPFWIVNTAELADGVLASFLLAAAVALGTRGSQIGGAFTSLLYGLALAALAMVRAALLPFAVVAFVWYLARCRSVRTGWFAGLLALLGFANGLAPWAVRNWQTFEEPLPITDSAYLHLWMGNSSRATGTALDEAALRQSLRPELLGQLLAEPHQPRRYARLGPELLTQVKDDPSGVLGHRLDAGACFLVGGSWLKERRLVTARTGENVAAAPAWVVEAVEPSLRGGLLVVLLAGALGWRLSAGWAWHGRLAALATVWVPLPYLLSHAEDLSGPRLPLDGVLLCYAAFALACVMPGFARRAEATDLGATGDREVI
jgi:hypothetical protein